MPIVGGLDIHRKQLTFDYLDTVTGEVKRGQIAPADREHLRAWLARFAGRDDVAQLAVTQAATMLDLVGRLAAVRGDNPGASELLSQSQALLRNLDGNSLAGEERIQYLLAVALRDNFLGQLWLSQEDHHSAAQLFTDGLTAARSAQDLFAILVSLYDLALADKARGDLAGAAGHLQEGLALAARAGDQTSAAYYLEALAAIAGQQDNAQRAVRLLTAARSVLETRSSGWLTTYAPRVTQDDAILAALRSRLDDAAFEQAQAWGRSAGTVRRAVRAG
jgi:hypothetical protein